MRVYVHAGVDKTGTTALQASLWVNRAWLAEQGIWLVRSGRHYFSADHRLLLEGMDGEPGRAFRDELDQAGEAGCHAMLLSWEGINFYRVGQLRQLQKLLEGTEVKIVLYLREQAQIIQSGYLQQVKQGVVRSSYQEFFERSSHLLPRARDYQAMLERFEMVFGQESMLVRIYDTGRLVGANIADDFLAELGLQRDAAFRDTGATHNPSLDLLTARFLLDADSRNLPRPERQALVDMLLERIERNGAGNRFFLDDAQLAKIRKHYANSNRWVAEKYFAGQELFPSPRRCDNSEAPPACGVARQAEMESLRRWLLPRQRVTSWSGSMLKGQVLQYVARRKDGWNQVEEWGVWTSGKTSVLRFRVFYSRIPPLPTRLTLQIRGQYFGYTGQSWVSVNGATEIPVALSGATLFVAAAEIVDDPVVTLRIRHDAVLSPRDIGQNDLDARSLAYGLTGLSYRIHSEGEQEAK